MICNILIARIFCELRVFQKFTFKSQSNVVFSMTRDFKLQSCESHVINGVVCNHFCTLSQPGIGYVDTWVKDWGLVIMMGSEAVTIKAAVDV